MDGIRWGCKVARGIGGIAWKVAGWLHCLA
jgi:hypothetical protein